MKKLLSSSDLFQLQLFAKKLLGAGIPCEIRAGDNRIRCPQLWIRNDIDDRRAAILFGGFTGGQDPEVLLDRFASWPVRTTKDTKNTKRNHPRPASGGGTIFSVAISELV